MKYVVLLIPVSMISISLFLMRDVANDVDVIKTVTISLRDHQQVQIITPVPESGVHDHQQTQVITPEAKTDVRDHQQTQIITPVPTGCLPLSGKELLRNLSLPLQERKTVQLESHKNCQKDFELLPRTNYPECEGGKPKTLAECDVNFNKTLTVDYGSHQSVLVEAVLRTCGDVLELGMGHYSTTVLHCLLDGTGRQIYSFDHNPPWVKKFANLNTSWHHIFEVDNWDPETVTTLQPLFQRSKRWSVAFVDQGKWEARTQSLKLVANNSDFSILHDWNHYCTRSLEPGFPKKEYCPVWYDFVPAEKKWGYVTGPPVLLCSSKCSLEAMKPEKMLLRGCSQQNSYEDACPILWEADLIPNTLPKHQHHIGPDYF